MEEEGYAEQWRRQIHACLLSEGPQLFIHVGILVQRPRGFKPKLSTVIGNDPRFAVTGTGNAMTVLARPAAAEPAAPSPSPYPQHPGREPCDSYMKTGTCHYGEKCHFNHPPKAAAWSGGAGVGASRVAAAAAVAAGAREAAPVRRGVVQRPACCLVGRG